MGHLERRILEVNRKRIKVVKPGSKASFPTTEVRGTYVPPFHVNSCMNLENKMFILECIIPVLRKFITKANCSLNLSG